MARGMLNFFRQASEEVIEKKAVTAPADYVAEEYGSVLCPLCLSVIRSSEPEGSRVMIFYLQLCHDGLVIPDLLAIPT